MADGDRHPGGRPTKYRDEFAAQAKKLCRLGATDAEMAEFFEVSESTINEWKLAYDEFSESIKKGKTLADAEIANSLYHRAKGYSHDAVKILSVSQGAGQPSEVQEVPYTEHYPPDTTAMIFWLKNRQPRKWRDKQEVEHSGPGGGALKMITTTMTAKEAAEAYAGTIDGDEE